LVRGFIQTEAELEDRLTEPRAELVDFIPNISSPLVVLGAGGKMGPSLAVLAQRGAEAAKHPLSVIAVSRFSDERTRSWLEQRGVKTIQADLIDRAAVQQLPESKNVVYLVGLKFGTATNPSLTWAVNTLAPAHLAERYSKARIVALSTGNVYPLVPVETRGATEAHPLTPLGEYANAAVARERILEYFSRKNATAMALLRLNYAVELRYGVLADIARKVWMQEPIDLTNGFFNCIWQGDANEMILRAFALAATPARAWNLTGQEQIRVRDMALTFAQLLGKEPRFTGVESDTALLSNSARLCAELGKPATPLDSVVQWIAHWLKAGGRSLDKPTHFEVRSGAY
jgi:nucleoside-diphosphate-sugar epimerase